VTKLLNNIIHDGVTFQTNINFIERMTVNSDFKNIWKELT
jgi:hypothetical protein